MPAGTFVDFYRILEVDPTASHQEIRRSFRRLILKAHPDKNPDRSAYSERRVRDLIAAYEVVGDRTRRKEFDRSYRTRARTSTGPSRPRESEFFFFKKSDPNACAHRILYFLLQGRGAEAVPLLSRLEARRGPEYLREELDKADYLDSLFLLGEYHLGRREYREAFRRLRTFYLHERNSRYPRHYLDAVIGLLKDLYIRKLPSVLPPEEALLRLREAADLRLGKRDQDLVLKVAGELREKLAGNGTAPARRRSRRKPDGDGAAGR